MKYIAIDIETLGLNPETDSIIQLGAVIDDTSNQIPLNELPKFEMYIDEGQVRGNFDAIQLHLKTGLLNKWQSSCRYSLTSAITQFLRFVSENFGSEYMGVFGLNKRITLAGKNIGSFDVPFLSREPKFQNFLRKSVSHRFLDPTENFIIYDKDEVKPSLKECRIRAGLRNTETAHTAVQDCLDVIELVRVVANKQKS